MKKNLFLTILALTFLLPSVAQADLPPIERYIQDPAKTGEGRLSYMIWDVYDATLYTPNGQYDPNGPLALNLEYLISLKGDKIAERSIVEMRKQGFKDEAKLSEWEQVMKNIFPDVDRGNNITGIRDNNGSTTFYKDGTKIGEVTDKQFSRHFFDIWLSQKTSEPKVREQLLGLK